MEDIQDRRGFERFTFIRVFRPPTVGNPLALPNGLTSTHKSWGMITLMILTECWTSSVAERPCEGSRGCQPTVLRTGGYCVAARRLMARLRIVFPGFKRRSATQSQVDGANRGLKPHGYHHEVAAATKTAILQS